MFVTPLPHCAAELQMTTVNSHDRNKDLRAAEAATITGSLSALTDLIWKFNPNVT